jgi:hypothetical protein
VTVRELITRLEDFDDEAMVYVPSIVGPINNGTVAFVCHMPHENIPAEMRIHIFPDVALLPGDMESYVTASDKIEDRVSDT